MQTCDNCGGKKEHSQEWSLSAELARSNRRMFIILLVVIVIWAATIGAFLLYINQFDYETVIETNKLDADQSGEGQNIAANGDVNYGTTSEN